MEFREIWETLGDTYMFIYLYVTIYIMEPRKDDSFIHRNEGRDGTTIYLDKASRDQLRMIKIKLSADSYRDAINKLAEMVDRAEADKRSRK